MLASARIVSGLFVVTFGFAWTVGQAGLEATNRNLCDLVAAISPWPISNCSFANWIVWLWGVGALFASIFLIADASRWLRSRGTYKSAFDAALLQNPERVKSSPLYVKLKYNFEPKTGYKSPADQVRDGKVEFQKLYDQARKRDLESYLIAGHMAEWLRENARFCYASSVAFFDVLKFIETRMDNLHAIFRNERANDDLYTAAPPPPAPSVPALSDSDRRTQRLYNQGQRLAEIEVSLERLSSKVKQAGNEAKQGELRRLSIIETGQILPGMGSPLIQYNLARGELHRAAKEFFENPPELKEPKFADMGKVVPGEDRLKIESNRIAFRATYHSIDQTLQWVDALKAQWQREMSQHKAELMKS